MAIVNLKRITDKENDYYRNLKSSDSLIFVKGKYQTDNSGPDCLKLTVGQCWYENATYLTIDPKRGIKIKPHASVVLETSEEIAVPLNVYGLLFGAGSNIYRGAFISSGKIDPGFSGKLRIGYHNGSDRAVILKPGDKLAYCLFIDAECDSELHVKSGGNQPARGIMTKGERVKKWFMQNAYQLLALAISIVSAAVSVITLILKSKGELS